MNHTSILLQESLKKLEDTMADMTPVQRKLFSELYEQIEKNGRFYEVTALTVPLMREHGYDVTEEDAGIIETIAEKVEIDPDMFWGAVEIWAEHYGIKQLEDY